MTMMMIGMNIIIREIMNRRTPGSKLLPCCAIVLRHIHIKPCDKNLFFVIWAATQTYADFETQIRAVLGRERIRATDYEEAARLITRMVLGACGIASGEQSNLKAP